MSLIIILASIYGIYRVLSAVIAAARESRRQEELARQKREREYALKQAKLEREQLIQAREQARLERQMKAEAEKQERLWAEQQKKNAQYEARLFKLEQKLELAKREEDHWNDEASAIRIDMAGLEGYIAYCKSKGLLCKGKEDELAKKSKLLYAAETKAIKARQARELCEMQRAAA